MEESIVCTIYLAAITEYKTVTLLLDAEGLVEGFLKIKSTG